MMERKTLYNLYQNHITYKYFIVLFCNKERLKVMYKSARYSTIKPIWDELRTQEKPKFLKMVSGRSRSQQNYELGLIVPMTKNVKSKTYVKDDLGRNLEAKTNCEKQRIKTIIPYWREEHIYDFDNKKRIRYYELMKYINGIEEIAQIFTLNNKLFVQIENEVRMFGNKNIQDASRLFDIVREELIGKNKGNFIFVKDITTQQRVHLYDLLVSKGYKRKELIRHYSY